MLQIPCCKIKSIHSKISWKQPYIVHGHQFCCCLYTFFSFPSGIALEIKTSLVTLHWIMKQNKGRRRKATWADGDLQREVQKRRAAVRGKRRLISHRESGAEHANRSARLLTLQACFVACLFVCVFSARCLSARFLPRCKFSTNTITGAPDDRYE